MIRLLLLLLKAKIILNSLKFSSLFLSSSMNDNLTRLSILKWSVILMTINCWSTDKNQALTLECSVVTFRNSYQIRSRQI